jgi:uncharacterized protein (DUF1015 family)
MAHIQAFRGIRYDLARIGDLSDVVAPPYDVIDPQLQDELYDRHPANVVRLILNRREPNDEADAGYRRAASFFRDWIRQGTLTPDKTPALYVYHQEFAHEGRTFVRKGFMARLRLEPFGTGRVYPHEQTHSRAKEDRLKLTKACRANLSQIFGLYPDPSNEVQQTIEAGIGDPTPLVATDHLGVIHRMWQVTDETTIARATALMADKPIFVADGHHRYETACNYREFLSSKGQLDPEHPANFLLTMFVGMDDPGLIVLPTHRLFRGVPALDSIELRSRLDPAFETASIGSSAELGPQVWLEVETADDPATLGVYTARDKTWTLATPSDSGRKLIANAASDRSSDWQSLGVAVLHELVIPKLLQLTNLPSPRYVHSVEEVVEWLHAGDSDGRDATGQAGSNEPFQLAALVRPASVDDIRKISSRGERMPAKSTYFFPKLLSGLVFHSLEP